MSGTQRLQSGTHLHVWRNKQTTTMKGRTENELQKEKKMTKRAKKKNVEDTIKGWSYFRPAFYASVDRLKTSLTSNRSYSGTKDLV